MADYRARNADVLGVERLLTRIARRDTLLGRRRPDAINALVDAVEEKLDAARRLRLARDRWALRAPEFASYRAAISRPLDIFATLRPALEDIKSLAGSSPSTLARLDRLIAWILQRSSVISPPEELTRRACRVRQRGAHGRERRADPPRSDAREQRRARVGRVVCGGRRADAGRPGANRHSDAAPAAAGALITPRRTRLVRVPDLQAFRQAIVSCSTAGGPRLDRIDGRRRADARRGDIICPGCTSRPASARRRRPSSRATSSTCLFNARLREPLGILTGQRARGHPADARPSMRRARAPSRRFTCVRASSPK